MSDHKKVICLGKEFVSEDGRREYFRNELRTKLPELKKIEGFPIGEDEDIINLSDPQYYTACPNPWLNDFITEWEIEKASISGRKKDFHVNEPYASDVSEGKNNPIYNAHSYHTKVPHPAIMRYILHYTQPGDIVFDGFAGTGMTGVAARNCGNPDNETKFSIEKEYKESGLASPVWGERNALLGDLSSVACLISHNYNMPIDVIDFDKVANEILDKIHAKYGWMYETNHHNGGKGKINYIVWSDVFLCPQCSGEMIFFEVAMDKSNGSVKKTFTCPTCGKKHTKRTVSNAKSTVLDNALGRVIQQNKTIPVLINYTFGSKKYEKQPDFYTRELFL